MFNIGAGELILVLLVAFLVVGPKDLPKVARWLARQLKSLRRLIREVRKETGWDEFAKEFKDVGEDVGNTFKQADVTAELNEATKDVERELTDVQQKIRDAELETRKDK